MKLIITGNIILMADEDNMISGGTLTISGKTYKNISVVDYAGEIPEDLSPEKYILSGAKITLNPAYEGNDIETRLNDIEQILIELLDTL